MENGAWFFLLLFSHLFQLFPPTCLDATRLDAKAISSCDALIFTAGTWNFPCYEEQVFVAMSAPPKRRCCRSAVLGGGDLHFSFSSWPWRFEQKAWVWQVQVWVWIVGFQIFEAPRDFSKIRSWPWAMRSNISFFFVWDVGNLWGQQWWRHNTDSCWWWLFVQEMSDDKWFSEDPLWHDTAKERTAKESFFFQMAPHSTWSWKQWGRFYGESSLYKYEVWTLSLRFALAEVVKVFRTSASCCTNQHRGRGLSRPHAMTCHRSLSSSQGLPGASITRSSPCIDAANPMQELKVEGLSPWEDAK